MDRDSENFEVLKLTAIDCRFRKFFYKYIWLPTDKDTARVVVYIAIGISLICVFLLPYIVLLAVNYLAFNLVIDNIVSFVLYIFSCLKLISTTQPFYFAIGIFELLCVVAFLLTQVKLPEKKKEISCVLFTTQGCVVMTKGKDKDLVEEMCDYPRLKSVQILEYRSLFKDILEIHIYQKGNPVPVKISCESSSDLKEKIKALKLYIKAPGPVRFYKKLDIFETMQNDINNRDRFKNTKIGNHKTLSIDLHEERYIHLLDFVYEGGFLLLILPLGFSWLESFLNKFLVNEFCINVFVTTVAYLLLSIYSFVEGYIRNGKRQKDLPASIELNNKGLYFENRMYQTENKNFYLYNEINRIDIKERRVGRISMLLGYRVFKMTIVARGVPAIEMKFVCNKRKIDKFFKFINKYDEKLIPEISNNGLRIVLKKISQTKGAVNKKHK